MSDPKYVAAALRTAVNHPSLRRHPLAGDLVTIGTEAASLLDSLADENAGYPEAKAKLDWALNVIDTQHSAILAAHDTLPTRRDGTAVPLSVLRALYEAVHDPKNPRWVEGKIAAGAKVAFDFLREIK